MVLFHTLHRRLLLLLFILLTLSVAGQESPDTTVIPRPILGPNDTIPVPAIIYQAEWVPGQQLEWIWIRAPYSKKARKKKEEWTRLRNAVYVTYPYARRAGLIMNEINARLTLLNDKEERKKYIKSREKDLKREFADPISDLSVYQGRVLMKLINRQTGNNCYEIIKEYKGGFTARFWQTIAQVFGSNLKQPYNATGAEKEIESIVMEVERMYRG
ncbi:MAG TPA: DUF4294 domain-containing protein [Flavitalea sp.]|nr:DUF4294 domain-containing protein [Flavitalea sp.]